MEQLLNKLKNELQKPLPGIAAQFDMAPVSRPKINIEDLNINDYKQSAVLILFCLDDQNNLFIPLIERYAYKGVHSAQISFPGGKFEEEDIHLQNTALRECFEEIGLQNEIEVIGKLTDLFIPVSSFLVAPYIGFCKINNPSFFLHEREVKSILKLPLEVLMDDSIIINGLVEADDYKIKTPYFLVEGHKVWGATAMILSVLKSILARL